MKFITGTKITFNDYDNNVFGELLFTNLPNEKIKELENICKTRSGVWTYKSYEILGREILSVEVKCENYDDY